MTKRDLTARVLLAASAAATAALAVYALAAPVELSH
jgi:hypothetical protein